MKKRIFKIISLILVAAAIVAVFACCRKEGPKGDTGEQGIQGIQGEKGDTGDNGADGADGQTPYIKDGYWWIGETNTGIKAEGSDGAQGEKGEKGDKGDKGDNGADGADGQTPYIKDGYWWIGETNTGIKAEGSDGAQGEKGDKGDNGADGADGQTPYIKDGYWWIGETNTGIKAEGSDGAQGEKGEKGDKGDKGDNGADGADGQTPYIKDGYWWIGETNTGIKAEGSDGAQGEKGDKGDKGDNGADGADGADGQTPYIKDGYWWIGETNTGIKAEGSDGAQGEKGDDGLSAYELYKKQHPEYTGTETEWLEAMANGQLTVYTVKFDLNGGTAPEGFETTLIVHYNSTIKLAIPTKKGHTFAGWYTGIDVTDGIFTETDKVTSNMTLVARWTPITVTVTFEDYYGDKVSVQTVNYGDKITPPAIPSRIGKMIFAGWDKSVELNCVTSDLTVKAIYVADTYTVKFETNGGTVIPDEGVYTGEIPTKPADPVKSGFSFAGWFLERTYQNEYKFDKALDADTTLYAKFNGDYITITTAEELAAIANDPTAKYMLGNDINLKGNTWTPINNFSGVLDGAGHKIINFVVSENDQYVGFIRKNSGTVQNLTFDDFMLSTNRSDGGNSYVGVIAAYNSGIITDCVIKNGTFKTSSNSPVRTSTFYNIGAVCGYNSSTGIIKNTRSYISIEGVLLCTNGYYSYGVNYRASNYCCFAGIAGRNEGSVDTCLYEGNISATANTRSNAYNTLYTRVGAIVAVNEKTGTISGCEANADINVKNSNSENVNEHYIGVICGHNNGKVSDCKTTGTATLEGNNSTGKIGGVVGHNDDSAIVSSCYSSVDITITNDSTNNYIGGIVGYNAANASVKMSVYTGSITANAAKGYGYILGYMADGSSCFKCYYSTASAMTIGEEAKDTGTVSEGTAKTPEEIHSTALLGDTLYWDSELWIISDGKAPELKAFN